MERLLMEFYTGGDGDIKIRAWQAITNQEVIAWLSRGDAEQVYNFIQARKMPTKEALMIARCLQPELDLDLPKVGV